MANIEKHLHKILAQATGARYYKVDLHIHTPSSVDAQGSRRYDYGKDDVLRDKAQGYTRARALAGEIITKLGDEGIQVAAFTDHNSPGFVDNTDFRSPAWYQLISEAYEQKRADDPTFPEILLLPGVEITTDRIHVLGIFDNLEEHIIFKIASLLREVDIREDEFGEVHGVFGTKSIWEVADAIDELGGICIPAHINALTSRSLLGQFEPPDMEIERLVQHRAIHTFGVVPTTVPWPDHRSYRSLMENKKVKRRGGDGPSFHQWMVEKRAAVAQHLPALGYMMNSDAHSLDKIGERFSWVKLDELSFRSLAAALRNPFYTIARNHLEPVSPVQSQVLGVSFDGGFADGLALRFNPHFNSLVGRANTGKTTLMRLIHDTFWGKRLGLRIRDELERTMEDIAPGLWDQMRGGEVFTKAGTPRERLPEEVKGGIQAGFLENRDVPWSMFIFFSRVEEDGRVVLYAAERRRSAVGVSPEDDFHYYQSGPLTGLSDLSDLIQFVEIPHKEFRHRLARPGFYFGRVSLGDESDNFQGARDYLDKQLLRVMDGYDELRRELFVLARELDDLTEQDPLDISEIASRVERVRENLESLFVLRTSFAEQFNLTEREHALRIAFKKGGWQEVVEAVPRDTAAVQEFTHKIRQYLHGQDFYDQLEMKFFEAEKRGKEREEVPFSQLSPARCSLMALRLLLNSSHEMAPVFINDPEDWLDNDALIEFYDMRSIRDDQLILFTQNPNIAVLGNAEQIFILDVDDGGRTESLASGGLENPGVGAQVIRLLEGGKVAFQRKLLRYRSELERDGVRITLQRM